MATQTPPAWWHPLGIRLAVLDTQPGFVHLGYGPSHLLITGHEDQFLVTWQLTHEEINSVSTTSQGTRQFSADMLRAAFGLTNGGGGILVRPGDFLADAYQAGHYIRSREYLNIPGPGCGLSNDPNLSVHLTFPVQQALCALLTPAL